MSVATEWFDQFAPLEPEAAYLWDPAICLADLTARFVLTQEEK